MDVEDSGTDKAANKQSLINATYTSDAVRQQQHPTAADPAAAAADDEAVEKSAAASSDDTTAAASAAHATTDEAAEVTAAATEVTVAASESVSTDAQATQATAAGTDGTSSNTAPETPVNPSARKTSELRDTDVLIGRGQAIHDYPGNRAFRRIISSHKHMYQKDTASYLFKNRVVREVIKCVHESGGRFLQRIRRENEALQLSIQRAQWKLMSETDVVDRIKGLLRDKKGMPSAPPSVPLPILPTELHPAPAAIPGAETLETSNEMTSSMPAPLVPSLINGGDHDILVWPYPLDTPEAMAALAKALESPHTLPYVHPQELDNRAMVYSTSSAAGAGSGSSSSTGTPMDVSQWLSQHGYHHAAAAAATAAAAAPIGNGTDKAASESPS